MFPNIKLKAAGAAGHGKGWLFRGGVWWRSTLASTHTPTPRGSGGEIGEELTLPDGFGIIGP